MLLSMFISFLTARKFHGVLYAVLMVLSVGLISFFSVGVPTHTEGDSQYRTGDSAIVMGRIVPLSYPLHASARFDLRHFETFYQVHFLGFLLKEEVMLAWESFHNERILSLTMFDYVLLYSLFMLINIVGVVVGYRLHKMKLKDRLVGAIALVQTRDPIRKRKLLKNFTIAVLAFALLILSAMSFLDAFRIWGRYMWVLNSSGQASTGFHSPNPEIDWKSLAFKDYVTMFPLQTLLGFVTASFSLVLVSMTLRRKTSWASAILLVSSASMLVEANNVWEVYNWAASQATTGSLSYYGKFLTEASNIYEAVFPLYVQVGLIYLVFGLFLAAMTIKERHKPERQITPPKTAGESSAAGVTLL